MGKADHYIHGDWNAICDRCGFESKASKLKEEWTGLRVCSECWEPRHPQDFLRGVPDDPSVPWTRPDSDADTDTTDIEGNSLTTINSPETIDDADKVLNIVNNHSIQDWNTALTGARTAIIVNAVNIGDRFTIYRTGGGVGTLRIWDGGTLDTTIPANVNAVVVIEARALHSKWQLISYTPLGL